MTSTRLLQQITPELGLYAYNDIPVLHLNHELGEAKIALQGAHLLAWRPKHAEKDVLWLSEIEPFESGKAIRGGIPLCYPWFSNAGTPAHGFARISPWHLSGYEIGAAEVRLVFTLFSERRIILAEVEMQFTDRCTLQFTHYGERGWEKVQLALHSYFRIGDIAQTEIAGLPAQCLNLLTGRQETVSSPLRIGELTDCIYTAPDKATKIVDGAGKRMITLDHRNAGDIVVWNPWYQQTGNMSPNAYRSMVCVETARIGRYLEPGEKVGVTLSVGNL